MRWNAKCQQSLLSDSRSSFRINVVRMVQTISVVIDWHVSSWATINSCRNNPTWGYSCLFYGLIFVGQDAEGTLHRKEYLTTCQNWISGDTYCWNQDIFIYFKDSSGHLLCHWNWRHVLHFKLTVYHFPLWHDVAWSSSFKPIKHMGVPHLISRTMKFSQWARKCPDPAIART